MTSSTIVSGRFLSVTPARAAIEALRARGVADDEIASFYVAPAGQHAKHPIGGDAHADAGAQPASGGATVGALAGGAAGLALGAVAAVAAPIAAVAVAAATTGVGAYVGSLYGALSRMKHGDEAEASPETPVGRPGGPVVAVRCDREGIEAIALAVLAAHEAQDVSRGEGEWGEGGWSDFDPRTPPPRVHEAELDAARETLRTDSPTPSAATIRSSRS
jgi:hypothetical protein